MKNQLENGSNNPQINGSIKRMRSDHQQNEKPSAKTTPTSHPGKAQKKKAQKVPPSSPSYWAHRKNPEKFYMTSLVWKS